MVILEIVEIYSVFAILWDENKKDGLASACGGTSMHQICWEQSLGSRGTRG